MKMTAAMITRPIAITTAKTHQPLDFCTDHSEAGKRATTWGKIRIDMPLPTPRSVISSPSHMITAGPPGLGVTMVGDGFVPLSVNRGGVDPHSRVPGRARG